jgi:hypothetical protein
VTLLIQGGTMLSEYARIIFPPGAKAASVDHFGGNSLSAVFLVGAAGIVLGLLAMCSSMPWQVPKANPSSLEAKFWQAPMDVTVLTLVALLALGATLVMSGSTLSGTVMSSMRPSTQT